MSAAVANPLLLPALASSTGRALFEYFNLLHPIRPDQLRGDESLEQFGIDSVEIPGLLDHVKREIGVEIEVGDVLSARTFAELIERIEQRRPACSPLSTAEAPRGAAERFAEHVNPHVARAMRHLHLD